MLIRPAHHSDAYDIAEVNVLAWQVAYQGLISQEGLDSLSVPDITAKWKKSIQESQEEVVFVCEEQGIAVGFVAFGPVRDSDKFFATTGEIYCVYVHPEYWRRGIGRQLVERIEPVAKEKGFSEVVLWVLERNRSAQGFYRSAGFSADGVSKSEYVRGSVVEEVRYVKKL